MLRVTLRWTSISFSEEQTEVLLVSSCYRNWDRQLGSYAGRYICRLQVEKSTFESWLVYIALWLGCHKNSDLWPRKLRPLEIKKIIIIKLISRNVHGQKPERTKIFIFSGLSLSHQSNSEQQFFKKLKTPENSDPSKLKKQM